MTTGNICRSPSAEAVFKAVVEREGVADRFFIDSCGTGGGSSNWFRENGFSYHEGDKAGAQVFRYKVGKQYTCNEIAFCV